MDESKPPCGRRGAGGEASAHRVDLIGRGRRAAAARGDVGAHGRIDILVNNAGITGGNAPTWELPASEWRRVVEVNLIGPFLACSAVIARACWSVATAGS